MVKGVIPIRGDLDTGEFHQGGGRGVGLLRIYYGIDIRKNRQIYH